MAGRARGSTSPPISPMATSMALGLDGAGGEALKGYLRKRRSGILHRKKVRWFTLIGRTLFYYETEDSDSTLGSIHFDDVSEVEKAVTRRDMFLVVGKNKVKLRAIDMETRDEWYNAIRKKWKIDNRRMSISAFGGAEGGSETVVDDVERDAPCFTRPVRCMGELHVSRINVELDEDKVAPHLARCYLQMGPSQCRTQQSTLPFTWGEDLYISVNDYCCALTICVWDGELEAESCVLGVTHVSVSEILETAASQHGKIVLTLSLLAGAGPEAAQVGWLEMHCAYKGTMAAEEALLEDMKSIEFEEGEIGTLELDLGELDLSIDDIDMMPKMDGLVNAADEESVGDGAAAGEGEGDGDGDRDGDSRENKDNGVGGGSDNDDDDDDSEENDDGSELEEEEQVMREAYPMAVRCIVNSLTYPPTGITINSALDLLRVSFGLSKSTARFTVNEEKRTESMDGLLRELADRYKMIERHPFYRREAFADFGDYRAWLAQERASIWRVMRDVSFIQEPVTASLSLTPSDCRSTTSLKPDVVRLVAHITERRGRAALASHNGTPLAWGTAVQLPISNPGVTVTIAVTVTDRKAQKRAGIADNVVGTITIGVAAYEDQKRKSETFVVGSNASRLEIDIDVHYVFNERLAKIPADATNIPPAGWEDDADWDGAPPPMEWFVTDTCACYRVLLKALFQKEFQAPYSKAGQLQAPKEVRQLSKGARWILREFTARFRVGPPYQQLVLLVETANYLNTTPVDLEFLEAALEETTSSFSKASMHVTIRERELFSRVKSVIADGIADRLTYFITAMPQLQREGGLGHVLSIFKALAADEGEFPLLSAASDMTQLKLGQVDPTECFQAYAFGRYERFQDFVMGGVRTHAVRGTPAWDAAALVQLLLVLMPSIDEEITFFDTACAGYYDLPVDPLTTIVQAFYARLCFDITEFTTRDTTFDKSDSLSLWSTVVEFGGRYEPYIDTMPPFPLAKKFGPLVQNFIPTITAMVIENVDGALANDDWIVQDEERGISSSFVDMLAACAETWAMLKDNITPCLRADNDPTTTEAIVTAYVEGLCKAVLLFCGRCESALKIELESRRDHAGGASATKSSSQRNRDDSDDDGNSVATSIDDDGFGEKRVLSCLLCNVSAVRVGLDEVREDVVGWMDEFVPEPQGDPTEAFLGIGSEAKQITIRMMDLIAISARSDLEFYLAPRERLDEPGSLRAPRNENEACEGVMSTIDSLLNDIAGGLPRTLMNMLLSRVMRMTFATLQWFLLGSPIDDALQDGEGFEREEKGEDSAASDGSTGGSDNEDGVGSKKKKKKKPSGGDSDDDDSDDDDESGSSSGSGSDSDKEEGGLGSMFGGILSPKGFKSVIDKASSAVGDMTPVSLQKSLPFGGPRRRRKSVAERVGAWETSGKSRLLLVKTLLACLITYFYAEGDGLAMSNIGREKKALEWLFEHLLLPTSEIITLVQREERANAEKGHGGASLTSDDGLWLSVLEQRYGDDAVEWAQRLQRAMQQ